jgi:hypothetical protein
MSTTATGTKCASSSPRIDIVDLLLLDCTVGVGCATIVDLLQALRTAGGEIGDLLQRTLEQCPDSTCLACGSGSAKQRRWRPVCLACANTNEIRAEAEKP